MIGHEFVLVVLAGVALALPYVLYARNRRRVFGIGLVVASVVYVGFAVFRGATSALLVELSGVVLFGLIAFAGVRYSSWVLALGWVMHAGWDLLLHPAGVSSYAPWWYPAACLGFDLFVAGAVSTRGGRP